MGIKGFLGFCECKGCRNRMAFEMDTILHSSDGSKRKKTMRICMKHAVEIARQGELKSATIEHTIDFD